ncbi:GntR family transcriptional regulator [Saccharopolyspora spinosa]|uniref:GntR family transcriptional regulator n=1 Tax=Saccharopolyspora spinosa TaxID=60894 RepID=A0A2N3Y0P8_SACSN|nr:GntR family transcriptional regulator [Saccharopolyspora spinosa]PKW16504.1 GntR family transcriptional regulator [Saccharopolyspora spinosa]
MATRPMYEVIRDDLIDQITTGALPSESRLPSEKELAEQYGVSRMTVRQALDSLGRDRLVVRRRGSGTFVAPPRARSRRLNRLGPFSDDVAGNVDTVTTIELRREVLKPPSDIAKILGLGASDEAVQLVRLRTVDDTPAAVQDSWIPLTIAPGLARSNLIDGSLYHTLAERCGVAVSWADQEITAAPATNELARWLDVKVNAPLIEAHRTTHDEAGRTVEYARSWTRPEFPFVVRLDA